MNKYVQFDESQIRKEIAAKVAGIYEIRILMTDFYNTKLSAYFDRDHPDQVISQMLRWNYPADCCVNFYMTINPVKEYCTAREQFNSLRKCRIMTQEEDIERLTWFAVDVDPEHPAGVSATDAEKETARTQAKEVLAYMETIGFTDPEVVDSGNGFHLKYRIDLPNIAENRDYLKMLNEDLNKRFPLVDKAIKDANRILKIAGTVAMKGRNTKDRPFRKAYIIREAGAITEERHAE